MSALADTQIDPTKAAVMANDRTTTLVSRTPLVTTGDITGATASQTEGRWDLDFTVTDDAARRVHDFSKQHVGSNLALVVDGKVHGTPRIAAAIIGNSYRQQLSATAIGNSYRIEGFNRADVERLATAISNGCRR
jgi:preprotein translocase subunit SecD